MAVDMTQVTTVGKIIKDAGGASAIERACGEAGIGPITRDAVYKWRLTGIPDRHWPIIMALTGCTAECLYAANCGARGVPTVANLLQSEAAE